MPSRDLLLHALALALIAGVGTTPAAADPPTPAACDRPRPRGASGIRAVDWCNLDVGGWKGALRDGHHEVHLYADLGEAHDTIATSLRSIDYGDLDGDRRPEAFLVIEQTTWIASRDDSSTGSDVAIYTLRGGRPVKLASIPIGTPVASIAIRRGLVELISGPDRARTRFRWRRGKGTVEVVPAP